MRELVCVDGDCLAKAATELEVLAHLRKLLEMLRALEKGDTDVKFSRAYYNCAAGSFGRELYEVLYTEWLKDDLDADFKRELQIALERSRGDEFEDADATLAPPGGDHLVRKDGQYRHLHSLVKDRSLRFGVLCELFGTVGRGTLTTADGTCDCFFLSSPDDLVSLARFSFEIRGLLAEEFRDAAQRAFPGLLIHPSVALTDIGVDLHSSFEVICSHLEFLNDKFVSVGNECGWDLFRMMGVARTKGLTFSDESSNTKQDSKKMKERDVVFEIQGKTHSVCCSLHTKIQPTIGRIHFHPPTNFSNGRVLVGKLHPHLVI